MKRKDAKLKLLKNENYQTEKQYNNIRYPDIYENTKYHYNNFSKSRQYSNYKKNDRTSSAFLERNYDNYMEKIFTKKNFINSIMIREKELNALLFKLKKYNNEVETYNKQKEESIKHLKNVLKSIEFKYDKLKELQDIELVDEKISVKNFNELKMSKADMEKKLFFLIKEKQDIDYSLKNEAEYNKTIEYMFEDEQNRLLSIKSETNEIEEKLFNIRKYQKIVNDNLSKCKKKDYNYEELSKKIDNDIKLIDQVNEKQYKDNKKIDNKIKNKEREVKYLEEQVKRLKAYNNNDINDYKNEIKEKIEKAKEVERIRLEDERKYIEIIYCLYIIQKYFTDEENFDKQKLLLSKEYKLLTRLNPEYIFSYSDNKNILSENVTKLNFSKLSSNKKKKERTLSSFRVKRKHTSNTNISQDDKKSLNNSCKIINNDNSYILANKNKYFKNNANKTSSTFFHSKLDINSYYYNDKNNIDELKDKFNNIKLTKQKLFDYNSKLISKLNFYRYQLDEFHMKEINLEDKKKEFELKVKDIISDNYFDFEELTKDSEKCKEFLEKNEYYINKMKKNNKKKKMKKIIEEINKDDLEEENFKDKKNKKVTIKTNNNNEKDEKKINNDDIVFKSSKNIIMTINNFFVTCKDMLKDIIISINNINNYNNMEDDGNKDKKLMQTKFEEDDSLFIKENNLEIDDNDNNNPFIKVFKKLIEYLKNKDIDISNDYKQIIQYIKNLIQYSTNTPNIKKSIDLDEINNNLYNKFYISEDTDNNKHIDKLFTKRFLSKKAPNFNNIYNHFTSLLEPSISNIKLIYELINNDSNQTFVENIIKNKNEINNNKLYNKKLFYSINNSDILNNGDIINNGENPNNNIIIKNQKKYKRFNSSEFDSNKFNELSVDEEDFDSIDTQSTKKKVFTSKKKITSIDEKITNKLYNPFLEKTAYLRKLNSNIPNINQMTSNNSKNNYEIKKIINDVDNISNQMKIYNNPSLDPNKLCDKTYNSLVKLMLNKNKKRNNIKTAKIRVKNNLLSNQ